MRALLKKIRPLIQEALAEDVRGGDITTDSIIEPERQGRALFIVKSKGVICGLMVAGEVFRLLDRRCRMTLLREDGDEVEKNERVAELKGPLRAILTGERLALNFLQRLSGIATLTRRFVRAVEGTEMKIYDTRKTTPLWRELEKYAVRTGGGKNHRLGLYDMVLIKDNHISAVGGVGESLERCLRHIGRRKVKIGVEVKNLKELAEVLKWRERIDLILLDNMSDRKIKEALDMVGGGRPEVEVSGGITIQRARRLARLGVRRVSVGALTHSAPALDISLEVLPE